MISNVLSGGWGVAGKGVWQLCSYDKNAQNPKDIGFLGEGCLLWLTFTFDSSSPPSPTWGYSSSLIYDFAGHTHMKWAFEAAENTFKSLNVSRNIPTDIICADLCSLVLCNDLPCIGVQAFIGVAFGRLCTSLDLGGMFSVFVQKCVRSIEKMIGNCSIAVKKL